MNLFKFATSDIAIDLGTANTLIMHDDRIVVNEPSIIAIDTSTGQLLAIGHQAQQMHEKTNQHVKTIRPLKGGVIADFTAAELLIRGLIKMGNTKRRLFAPAHRMVVSIPSGITEVEKRAVKDSCQHAGAKELYLVHEPVAAAIGIGIDVTQPNGTMIIDIGGGDHRGGRHCPLGHCLRAIQPDRWGCLYQRHHGLHASGAQPADRGTIGRAD